MALPFNIPSGYDRADGVTPLPIQPYGTGGTSTVGTATPAGALVVQGPGGGGFVVQESTESPTIERAEQCTVEHTLKDMTWLNALQCLGSLGRGAFMQDSFGYIWRVLSSKISSRRGGNAEFSYVAESISFDSPPDDFQITPVELGIDIIKYPRYFYALYPSTANYIDGSNDYTTTVGTGSNTTTRAQVKSAIIRAIQTYRDSPYFPLSGQTSLNSQVQNQVIASLSTSIIPTLLTASSNTESPVNVTGDNVCSVAIAAASEIINKLWFQIDAPYIAGWQITWSQYFFQPVQLSPGGYIEDPSNIVPDFFMQAAAQAILARGQLGGLNSNLDTLPPTPGGIYNTIFSGMASLNPACYSNTGQTGGLVSISWLRKADEVVYERTWFKVTHTWIGSPVGLWDNDIYGGYGYPPQRPTSASQYNTTFPLVG